jgi:hypothetical protein
MAGLRLTLRLTTHARVLEVDVVDFGPSGSFSAAFPKIEEALKLIAEHDSRRFARLRRDLRYVILTRTTTSDVGEYWPALRACLLDVGFVAAQTSGVVALTIVHEATHARLRAAGIGYAGAHRARVERCCIGEEIVFAKRVPDGTELLAYARRKPTSDEFWSDAAVAGRRLRRWRSLGWPAWLTNLAKR